MSDSLGDVARRITIEAVARLGGHHLLVAATPHGHLVLHLAASLNRPRDCELLVRLGCPVDAADAQGLTPLSYAVQTSVQGGAFADASAALLELGAAHGGVDGKGRSLLFHAARLGRPGVLRVLLAAVPKESLPAMLAQRDIAGYSPLLAAVLVPGADQAEACVRLLLDAGADPGAKTRDGSTALHICSRRAEHTGERRFGRLLSALIEAGARISVATNGFGATIMHTACGSGSPGRGSLAAVHAIWEHATVAERRALLAAQDNDGLTALHVAVTKALRADAADEATMDQHNTDNALSVVAYLLDKAGAFHDSAVNQTDYGGATALTLAAWSPASATQLRCVDLLLDSGADLTWTDEQKWTALHISRHLANPPLEALLRRRAPVAFLRAIDPDQPRDLSNDSYLRRCGAHNRIPLEVRRGILGGDHGIGGVARWLERRLRDGPTPQIVVLTGAGISVGAGIPDFRSKGTGLYSNAKYTHAFTREGFARAPGLTWTLARNVFGGVHDGTIRPTTTHYFIQLLHLKGLLRRNYTQNIDGLEAAAGLPDEQLVEAHGTFRKIFCPVCGHEPDAQRVWAVLLASRAGSPDEAPVPRCERCGPSVAYRPSVTMFGEPLPDRYHALNLEDLQQADCIIVMGTTLVVYPFAGLVNQVSEMAPRLLANKELTGPFRMLERKVSTEDKGEAHFDLAESSSYRDAAFVGTTDDGVTELCKELGWKEDLEALMEPERETEGKKNKRQG